MIYLGIFLFIEFDFPSKLRIIYLKMLNLHPCYRAPAHNGPIAQLVRATDS
jgi:hypothetical protein